MRYRRLVVAVGFDLPKQRVREEHPEHGARHWRDRAAEERGFRMPSASRGRGV